ncbi:hypothetical protein [Rhizobium mongolense]|uniref:hypothetical protein n=1 Tax=Rhizobium mongolense TaxID=57676 RepID=UPI001F32751B|nr:hypothetical protein [Rhizobium mongolense]
MLTFLGYAMVASFMTLTMTKRMTALVALMVVPIVFGFLAGAGGQIGEMMMDGLVKLAPTAAMLFFGIIYFCIMTDAGCSIRSFDWWSSSRRVIRSRSSSAPPCLVPWSLSTATVRQHT